MSFDYAEFAAAFPWFFPAVASLFGACIGSFLNVAIYRLPKEESVIRPGSHCGCGQSIKWHDNIPVLSWLLLRGRARCCRRPFSVRYPFVELLTAALFMTSFAVFAPSVAACGVIFLSALVAATFIDLDHFIIPDVFTIGLAVVGVSLSLAVPALHGQHSGFFLADSLRSGFASIVGVLIGSAVVLWIGLLGEAILKKEAMGFGDVKFVGAIGAFCGWQGAVFSLLGGAIVFFVWFGVAWLWEKMSGRRASAALPSATPEGEPTPLAFSAQVPFGPMLAIAGALYFLVFRDAFNGQIAEMAFEFNTN
jgi:leader peptidase (prepilin peptidase)/N-methyltransferase